MLRVSDATSDTVRVILNHKRHERWAHCPIRTADTSRHRLAIEGDDELVAVFEFCKPTESLDEESLALP
jgi:hypothetical protein